MDRGVNVTVDEVAADALAEPQCVLNVHRIADRAVSRRGPGQRFGHDVERDFVAGDRNRGETDAVDRHRILGLGPLALDALAAHCQR